MARTIPDDPFHYTWSDVATTEERCGWTYGLLTLRLLEALKAHPLEVGAIKQNSTLSLHPKSVSQLFHSTHEFAVSFISLSVD